LPRVLYVIIRRDMQRRQGLTHLVTHLSGGVRANLSDPNILKVFPTAAGTPELIPLPGPMIC
jgi:hypothetical protein